MPTAAPRPCPKHPSVLLRHGIRCKQCEVQRKALERGRAQRRRDDKDDSVHFYVTPRWRKLRAWFIRQHPLCAECGRQGRTTPAEHVDHIVPMADGGAAWDESNLEPLCKPCHSRKTMRELNRRRYSA